MNDFAAGGLDLSSLFDQFDAVETLQDLEALFDVLDGVRDGKGRPAVFTAYAVSANPDFGRIRSDRRCYQYESVPETFARLAAEQPAAYEGAWKLWQQGIARGLIQPQFHGREHLNVELIKRKLHAGALDLKFNLDNDCMAALSADPGMPGVAFTEAFELHDRGSVIRHAEVIRDGLDLFERVWGFRSRSFTPPAQALHPSLHGLVESAGVVSIDKPLRCIRPMGDGTYEGKQTIADDSWARRTSL